MPDARLPLTFEITAGAGRDFVPFLRKNVVAAHRMLRPRLQELSLALVGDARMARLHEQFLGQPGPTDVLTFPLETDRRGVPLSGEVVVCVAEARRRAGGKIPVAHEVLLYAVHGLLHLCGYDDKTSAGFSRMHQTEDDILRRLGVGPVFSPVRPAAAAAKKAAARRRQFR